MAGERLEIHRRKKAKGEDHDKPPPILLSFFCLSEQQEKEGRERKGGWGGQVAELLDEQCLFSPILIYEVVLLRRSVSKQAMLWHWRPLLFPLLCFQTEHCARVIWENQGQGRKGEGALMEAWVGHFSLTLGEEKERGSGEPLSRLECLLGNGLSAGCQQARVKILDWSIIYHRIRKRIGVLEKRFSW